MSCRSTISCMYPFIVLEHLFCIDRVFLIESQNIKLLCRFLNSLGFVFTLAMNVMEILNFYEFKTSMMLRTFQLVLFIHLFRLAYSSRKNRDAFEVLSQLDQQCGMDDEYCVSLKNKAILATAVLLSTSLYDMFLLVTSIQNTAYACIWAVASAQESEMIFYALLIEAINIRLTRLDNARPTVGASVYRRILICSTTLNEEFQYRVMTVVVIKFVSTICLLVYYILTPSAEILLVTSWRFLHWHMTFFVLCAAAYRTSCICRTLCLRLSARLALPQPNQMANKEMQSSEKRALRRWLNTMDTLRPQYGTYTQLISISMPLELLDLGATYLLVAMQAVAYIK